MNPLLITSAVMAVASFFDGKSTVDFLRTGKIVEVDPIMVFLFGSDTPTAKRVWVTGSLVIAAEVGIALTLATFFPDLKWALVAQQLSQAAVHVFEYFRNTELIKSL